MYFARTPKTDTMYDGTRVLTDCDTCMQLLMTVFLHTIVTAEVSSDDSDSLSEPTIKSRRLRNVVARLTHTGNQALTVKMMMSSYVKGLSLSLWCILRCERLFVITSLLPDLSLLKGQLYVYAQLMLHTHTHTPTHTHTHLQKLTRVKRVPPHVRSDVHPLTLRGRELTCLQVGGAR